MYVYGYIYIYMYIYGLFLEIWNIDHSYYHHTDLIMIIITAIMLVNFNYSRRFAHTNQFGHVKSCS